MLFCGGYCIYYGKAGFDGRQALYWDMPGKVSISTIQSRIRHKITLAVLVAISASMLVAALLQGWLQERVALREREQALTVLTDSIAVGIEATMMTGSTDAALSFANHFREIPYISDFRIVRSDGKEAFKDNRTIDQVNLVLDEIRYPRRPDTEAPLIREPNDPRLLQALQTNQVVKFYEESAQGGRVLTLLAPIEMTRECRECHTSSRTRGVIQLTTSLAAIDQALAESRHQSLIVLLASLVLTFLIARQLLRQAVCWPLERLMSAMRDFSAGDLEQHVDIDRRDEFGEMARIFNTMTSEIRLSHNELHRLSTTDALTGLRNRRYHEDQLGDEYDLAMQTGQPFAVVLFDIDHFKQFNDVHGHEQGDRVLQAVAKAFTKSLRNHDTACRYGGEEFVAILPDTTLAGAKNVAERVRHDIEQLVVDGLSVTISAGVAAFPDLPAGSTDELLKAADRALYTSKGAGRNRVTLATPDQLQGAVLQSAA